MAISNEALEHHALIFCQGDFHRLGIVFEELLLVAGHQTVGLERLPRQCADPLTF